MGSTVNTVKFIYLLVLAMMESGRSFLFLISKKIVADRAPCSTQQWYSNETSIPCDLTTFPKEFLSLISVGCVVASFLSVHWMGNLGSEPHDPALSSAEPSRACFHPDRFLSFAVECLPSLASASRRH